jgi:predicted DNA-binding protein
MATKKTKQLGIRVPVAVATRLELLAARSRVTLSEYVRWLCEDAVAGKYKPSHL